MVLLSAAYGDRRLCLLLLPAVVMLGAIQTGGYIPEERNLRYAEDTPRDEAEKAADEADTQD